jgi:hypothetical protein
MSSAAAANVKKPKGVSCQPLNNSGAAAGNAVSFTVTPRSANSAAAPMAAATMAAANAAKKDEVDAIVAEINAAAAKTVTTQTLPEFNALLKRYRAAVPTATGVDNIPASTGEGELLGLVQAAVAAVKASAPKAGGGRRKTHRKKHSMRSKRHCKTHKKHGGKRSTKHHKKHGKTRGKRSKTHKKRHHKKH